MAVLATENADGTFTKLARYYRCRRGYTGHVRDRSLAARRSRWYMVLERTGFCKAWQGVVIQRLSGPSASGRVGGEIAGYGINGWTTRAICGNAGPVLPSATSMS